MTNTDGLREQTGNNSAVISSAENVSDVTQRYFQPLLLPHLSHFVKKNHKKHKIFFPKYCIDVLHSNKLNPILCGSELLVL